MLDGIDVKVRFHIETINRYKKTAIAVNSSELSTATFAVMRGLLSVPKRIKFRDLEDGKIKIVVEGHWKNEL